LATLIERSRKHAGQAPPLTWANDQ